ncbi:MAG: hypothetical protein GY795_51310 [Desulfobacterales bacterium]|nr:hypothetical protein [Desulfobacterales bacterium]
MNRRRFIFELLHTDAAKLEGDVVLFGHKNPLKEHLEKTQKAKFKVFKVPRYFGIYEGRAEAELLNLKDHNWKRAVAVKYKLPI